MKHEKTDCYSCCRPVRRLGFRPNPGAKLAPERARYVFIVARGVFQGVLGWHGQVDQEEGSNDQEVQEGIKFLCFVFFDRFDDAATGQVIDLGESRAGGWSSRFLFPHTIFAVRQIF